MENILFSIARCQLDLLNELLQRNEKLLEDNRSFSSHWFHWHFHLFSTTINKWFQGKLMKKNCSYVLCWNESSSNSLEHRANTFPCYLFSFEKWFLLSKWWKITNEQIKWKSLKTISCFSLFQKNVDEWDTIKWIDLAIANWTFSSNIRLFQYSNDFLFNGSCLSNHSWQSQFI